jgi:hypothetical protein
MTASDPKRTLAVGIAVDPSPTRFASEVTQHPLIVGFHFEANNATARYYFRRQHGSHAGDQPAFISARPRAVSQIAGGTEMNRKLLMLAGIALLAGGGVGKAEPATSTQAESPTAPEAGSTSTDVRSPTSTDVRSPTNTSTQAHTSDNVTVTGGAGDGNTSVNIYPGQSAQLTGQAPGIPQSISTDQTGQAPAIPQAITTDQSPRPIK